MKEDERGGACSTHGKDDTGKVWGKVNLSLCLVKYQATKTYPLLKYVIKTYWGMEVYVELHTFLTSVKMEVSG
jgi:hypothetical protein